jgi:hypothetical protein
MNLVEDTTVDGRERANASLRDTIGVRQAFLETETLIFSLISDSKVAKN